MQPTLTKSLLEEIVDKHLQELLQTNSPREDKSEIEYQAYCDGLEEFANVFGVTLYPNFINRFKGLKRQTKSLKKEELIRIILEKNCSTTEEESKLLLEPHLPTDNDRDWRPQPERRIGKVEHGLISRYLTFRKIIGTDNKEYYSLGTTIIDSGLEGW